MKKIMLVILVLACFALVSGNSLKSNRFTAKNFEAKSNLGFGVTGESEAVVKKFFRKYLNPAGKVLNVFNKKGNIKVIGWDRDYAVVTATMMTKNPDAESPIVNVTTGEDFTIRSECTVCWSISYVIRVPKSMTLGNINTSDGRVIIKNLPKVK